MNTYTYIYIYQKRVLRERASFDNSGPYKSQHWRYSFRRCELNLKCSVNSIEEDDPVATVKKLCKVRCTWRISMTGHSGVMLVSEWRKGDL